MLKRIVLEDFFSKKDSLDAYFNKNFFIEINVYFEEKTIIFWHKTLLQGL